MAKKSRPNTKQQKKIIGTKKQAATKAQQDTDFEAFQKDMQDPAKREAVRRLVGGRKYDNAQRLLNLGDKLDKFSSNIDMILDSGTAAGRTRQRAQQLQRKQLEELQKLSQHGVDYGVDEFDTTFDNEAEVLTEDEKAELEAIQQEYEREGMESAEEDVDKPSVKEIREANKKTVELVAALILIFFAIILFISIMNSTK